MGNLAYKKDTASIDMESTDTRRRALARFPNGGGKAALLSIRRPGGTVEGREEAFGKSLRLIRASTEEATKQRPRPEQECGGFQPVARFAPRRVGVCESTDV
ncbi:uncharacterized protein P884DRAFT_94574 [Thermothelomyces heterothallicus CBS 202.75]|uniref:uncharacterized protein n=1 Tax=Thermothelomyces heterothallicus CBS 202.75 TaxID=1149848 RepID=UPI0037442CE6